MLNIDPEKLDWQKVDNMLPAIVQDATSLRVLMLGYMNREALDKTLKTGLVTFYSRTRQTLWTKGETSGNVLKALEMRVDCDNDTLLILADAVGPTCHTGSTSCFGESELPLLTQLADLQETIAERKANPTDASYTASLFKKGLPRIAQKVGEEGVETALAGALQDPKLSEEAADLLYHLLVLLAASGMTIKDPLRILRQRASAK